MGFIPRPVSVFVRPHLRVCALLLAVFALSVASAAPSAPAAGSTTVVTATVPSATTVGATGCAPGVVDKTAMGVVPVNTVYLTLLDCGVSFGASNNTSSLRVFQSDGFGSAMAALTYGRPADVGATSDPGGGASINRLHGIARQTDGALVFVGNNDANTDAYVARQLPNGSLDAAGFGTGGIYIFDYGASDLATSVVLDALNRIYVVGSTGAVGAKSAWVARLTTAGTLDTTWAFDGVAEFTFDLASEESYGTAITIDSLERIYVAGVTTDDAGPTRTAALARFDANGVLDPAFSGDGVWNGNVLGGTPGNLPAGDMFDALAIMPDGSLVAAGQGTITGQGTNVHGIIGRFDVAGVPINTFGTSGFVAHDFGTGTTNATIDAIQEVVIDSAGRIVVAGRGVNGEQDAIVARLNPVTGALDPTFNGGAIARVDIGVSEEEAAALMIQPDGRIVVGGKSDFDGPGGVYDDDIFFGRLTSAGLVDTTFGNGNGYIVQPVAGTQRLEYIIPGREGGILGAGYGAPGAAARMVNIAGYPVNDFQFGVQDWNDGTAAFGICLETVGALTASAAGWTLAGDNNCIEGIETNWRDVPDHSSIAQSLMATGSLKSTTSSVTMRFGFRAATDQVAGAYAAPITFLVLAP